MSFKLAVASVMVAGVCSMVVACGGGAQGDAGDDGPVEVVATFSILGDLVKNVGGEEIELTTLVGANGDAHTFEPAPADGAKLSGADVVFENGLEFETWLDDLYESSGSEAERIAVTKNIDTLAAPEEEHAEEEGHEGEEHGEADPHAWHDADNAVTMVEAVREALVEADPENAQAYRDNAKEYLSSLEELDAEVKKKVESVPRENRVLFTSHDTFGYFAERYGFEVDTALASISTEASDPSAGETAALIRKIKTSGVPAVFAENVSNADSMQRVASESGVDLAPTLYTDALGEPQSEGGTYVKMMRYNVSTITEALTK